MNPQGFRWIHFPTRLAIYDRDGWLCLACCRPGSWSPGRGKWTDLRPEALSLDHVVPRRQGGRSAPDNLVTLCVGCNSQKADRHVLDVFPERSDVILAMLKVPINRPRGRSLALKLCPAWADRMVLKATRARQRRTG